jgi:hypothetical protein
VGCIEPTKLLHRYATGSSDRKVRELQVVGWVQHVINWSGLCVALWGVVMK